MLVEAPGKKPKAGKQIERLKTKHEIKNSRKNGHSPLMHRAKGWRRILGAANPGDHIDRFQ